MEVPTISVDPEEARQRVAEFTARQRRKLTDLDKALYRGFKALTEGLTLIDVNEAIKAGGQFEGNHCPRIALARADLKTQFFEHSMNYALSPRGQLAGSFEAWSHWEPERNAVCRAFRDTPEAQQIGLHRASLNQGLRIDLEPGMLKTDEDKVGARRWFKTTYATAVPEIPFHLRPNGDVSKYFILWEVAEWRGVYHPPRAPRDPFLLERIAHPVYVVVAQWDLTELEQRLLEAFRGRR